MSPASRRRAFTLVELLVALAVVATLIGLLLPAVQQTRESAARAKCQNNLKQLGLALHAFHAAHGVFPASGWTQAGPGNPAGKYVGWRPLTLPYIEQEGLQRLYDFGSDWWAGTNPVAAAVPVKTYQCPSVPRRAEVLAAVAKPPRPALAFVNPVAPTDYEAVLGVQPASVNPHAGGIYTTANRFSVMSRNSATRLTAVTDGTSSTVMVVECGGRPLVFRGRAANPGLANDQGVGWADSEGPFSLDGSAADGSAEGCGAGCAVAMNARNDNEPYSFHPGGGNLLFADGHVGFVREVIPLPALAALCTMSAGETVGDY